MYQLNSVQGIPEIFYLNLLVHKFRVSAKNISFSVVIEVRIQLSQTY
jgi:hypothetical protein